MSKQTVDTLEFEKNILEIEDKIKNIKKLEETGGIKLDAEISRLQSKLEKLLKTTYAKLTPWQKTQVARHAMRPHCIDYINGLIDDMEFLSGDRNFADDMAIIGGIGRFRGQSVVVMGQEKGHDHHHRG